MELTFLPGEVFYGGAVTDGIRQPGGKRIRRNPQNGGDFLWILRRIGETISHRSEN